MNTTSTRASGNFELRDRPINGSQKMAYVFLAISLVLMAIAIPIILTTVHTNQDFKFGVGVVSGAMGLAFAIIGILVLALSSPRIE